jgi:glycosyltransferase involved in cell wall biosynthesis
VLFAGRLEYEKGVQTVLHALERLRVRHPAVRFLIAGVGTYSDELRRLVDELGLGHRVRFTGFLEERALRLHYAASDVAVAPSIYEPFGLVATEAMACGTPVVASDTGGLREILAEGHGLTFPPQDAEQLADRIAEVLTDPELARGLVSRGRERIRALYDWGDVARRTADVLDDVTRSYRAGGDTDIMPGPHGPHGAHAERRVGRDGAGRPSAQGA